MRAHPFFHLQKFHGGATPVVPIPLLVQLFFRVSVFMQSELAETSFSQQLSQCEHNDYHTITPKFYH